VVVVLGRLQEHTENQAIAPLHLVSQPLVGRAAVMAFQETLLHFGTAPKVDHLDRLLQTQVEQVELALRLLQKAVVAVVEQVEQDLKAAALAPEMPDLALQLTTMCLDAVVAAGDVLNHHCFQQVQESLVAQVDKETGQVPGLDLVFLDLLELLQYSGQQKLNIQWNIYKWQL
jgi:hypothetical protein